MLLAYTLIHTTAETNIGTNNELTTVCNEGQQTSKHFVQVSIHRVTELSEWLLNF